MSLTRSGEPCQSKMVYRTKKGTLRCKWHGGRCTGPKTPEGKMRVTQNLVGRARSPARALDFARDLNLWPAGSAAATNAF